MPKSTMFPWEGGNMHAAPYAFDLEGGAEFDCSRGRLSFESFKFYIFSKFKFVPEGKHLCVGVFAIVGAHEFVSKQRMNPIKQ